MVYFSNLPPGQYASGLKINASNRDAGGGGAGVVEKSFGKPGLRVGDVHREVILVVDLQRA